MHNLFRRSGDGLRQLGDAPPRDTRLVQSAFSPRHRLMNVGDEMVQSESDGGRMDMSRACVMGLLHAQVPLSLLHDLMSPQGPGSAEIFAVEVGRLDPQGLHSEPALN